MIALELRRQRRRRRLILAAVLLLIGLLAIGFGGGFGRESAVDRARRLSASHHIRIAFGDPSTFFVAPYGPADARIAHVELTATDADSAATALEGIERALRQYPDGFVASVIKGIFVAGEMRVDGADAGGTVGPAWVVLAAPARLGREGIFATSYIGVHHELSSFVYHRKSSTSERWAHFAPAGWRRTTDAKQVIATATKEDPDPATGFLSAYGASNEENDFNVYAEKLFTEPQRVAELARTHELVRTKLEFVMTEYEAIDRRMSDVFSDLGLR